MNDAPWFDGPELEKVRFPYTDFVAPSLPPDEELTVSPFRKLCINARWAKFVVGALSRMLKSDAWEGAPADVDTGILAIEAMIAQLAIDYDECEKPDNGGTEIEPPPPELVYVGGGLCFGECDMPCIDLTGLIRQYNGRLQIRNSCCEWVDISTDGTTPGGSVVEPVTPDPEVDNLACRKSTAIAETFNALCAEGWESYNPNFFSWQNHLETAYPSLKLQSAYLFRAWASLSVNAIIGILGWTEAFPATALQRLKCMWNSVMHEGDTSVTEDEYNQMDTMLLTLTTGNAGDYVVHMFRAIRFDALQALAASAVSVDDANCDCPDAIVPTGETEPTEGGWYLSALLDESTIPVPFNRALGFPYDSWGYAFASQELEHDVFGWVCEIAKVSGFMGALKRANDHVETVMGPCDVYLCGSNSDADTPPRKYAQMNQAEFDALGLAAQGYIRLAPLGTDDYASYNDPPAVAGQVACFAFGCQVYPSDPSQNGTVRISGIRWLMNTNSASHQ